MRKSTTKRALIMSALAMLLSISMLVGTTFAWFTDSVSSANNVIVAGNLDVELEYWDGEKWVDVAGKSDILTNTLWEPGVTEVAYLRVKNAGSLALKYQLGINIVSETAGVNKAGETFKLSDYIQFGVVEGVNGETGAYANREAAVAAVANAQKISAGYTKAASMTAGQELYLALVVYMPTTVGNEANHNGIKVPQIDLGINIFATQAKSESDSFGDNYDAGAWDYWDGKSQNTEWFDSAESEYVISTAAELAGFAALVNDGKSFAGKTVKLAADMDLCGATWTPIGISSSKAFAGTFDGQGHTVRNFNLKTSAGNYGAGFFGNLLNNTVVKNVNFDSVSYTTRSNCVGVVAGYIYGSGTFENIHVTNANVKSFAKVGGIVGLVADPGAHTITLTNCSVEGTIGGGYNVGGLMGLVLQNVTVNVTDCSTDVEFIINDSGYDMEYVKNANGEWMWNYNNQWNYAAVAEQYCYYDAQQNEFCMGEVQNVNFAVSGPKQLEKALKAGGTVVLGYNINITSDIAISNANFVLDGNGYTITGTSNNAIFDITGGTVTIKNVIFDGIKNGAAVRTVNGVEFTADNVTVQNCEHTMPQGLFRLLGKSTITNCTFKNNTCSMAITLNYDGANNDPQIVKNCVFEANTCNGTAVVYYVKGESCTLVDNQFIGNTVNCDTNGATVYMGFTENNIVTGNLFKNNTVTDVSSSTRVSGGIFFGYETEFEDNYFINNKASNAAGDALGNNVCVSTYYTDIDLSGNYWGGAAPVEGVDYFVQHKTYGYVVIIDDYLTSYGE